MRSQVDEHGYAVVPDLDDARSVRALLSHFGVLVPQYDGELTYEVKAEPGFEHRHYSKSQNEIRAHTEAPGWDPPPRYLALWCHRQASIGGHTSLADVRRYLHESLGAEKLQELRTTELHWSGTNTSGGAGSGAVAPLLASRAHGDTTLRFSVNILCSGHYDPPVDLIVEPEALPLGAFGVSLASQVHEFFSESAVDIRIPERAVLVWDNHRMAHARAAYADPRRHLTRYWMDA